MTKQAFLKKQELSPEKYRKSNQATAAVLLGVYILFIIVEFANRASAGGIGMIVRIAVDVLITVISLVLVKVRATEKRTMLFYAYSFTIAYAMLIFTHEPVMMVFAFPVIMALTVYLNSLLVMSGSIVTLAMIIIRIVMLRQVGQTEQVSEAQLIFLLELVCIAAVYYTINRLIQFSESDQRVIQQKVEKQQDVANQVASVVEEINHNFQGVMDEFSEINDSMRLANNAIGNIAGSTERTTNAIDDQVAMTEEIQARLENANQNAEFAKNTTDELLQTIENGVVLAGELKEQSDLVDANTVRISQTVEQLVQNVDKVAGITDTILSISSQTNLLALNASIEAARAGDAGRGFAVVAEEIRQLAEQTRSSTERITEIMNELVAVTSDTQSEIQASVENLNSQREKVEHVNARFQEVGDGMRNLHTGVCVMSEEVTAVMEANRQIVESIQNVAGASQEVSAETQTSTATIQTVADGMINFSGTVDNTFARLQELTAIVNEQDDKVEY
jgi:methyl-accepting chemotaxis protein